MWGRILAAGVIPYVMTEQVQSVNRMTLHLEGPGSASEMEDFFHVGTLVIGFGGNLVLH